jgi:hypothetical protein
MQLHLLPSCHCCHPFSQYFTTFGTPTAKDLALKTFLAMDAAWHTPSYGGYLENAANGFPQDLPPPNTTAASVMADEDSVIDALKANSTDAASSGEVVSVNSSTPADANGSAGLTAVGNEPRSPMTLMHGVEALAALHKVTNGEPRPLDLHMPLQCLATVTVPSRVCLQTVSLGPSFTVNFTVNRYSSTFSNYKPG